jgi:hypothetical protein
MEDKIETLWWSSSEFCEEGWPMQNWKPRVDMSKVDIDPDISGRLRKNKQVIEQF